MSLSFDRRFSLNRRHHKKLLINNIAIENLLFMEHFFIEDPRKLFFYIGVIRKFLYLTPFEYVVSREELLNTICPQKTS